MQSKLMLQTVRTRRIIPLISGKSTTSNQAFSFLTNLRKCNEKAEGFFYLSKMVFHPLTDYLHVFE